MAYWLGHRTGNLKAKVRVLLCERLDLFHGSAVFKSQATFIHFQLPCEAFKNFLSRED